MTDASAIRAAGVVLMRGGGSDLEVLVLHRPLREDWSLPKGKVDAGEHVITAAIRECDEETGFTPVLGSPLPSQSYSVQSRPKVVNYWAARVGAESGFAPDDEVDKVRWVSAADAGELLTYDTDRALVAHASSLPRTTPIVILRHTQAQKRADFSGKVDSERPLSGRGRSQAKMLTPLLDAFGIEKAYASNARRCEETLRRFAKSIGQAVEPEPALSEDSHAKRPRVAAARARELARSPAPLVLCSHRPVLPTICAAIAAELGIDADDPRWSRTWDPHLPPGGFIVIHRSFDDRGNPSVVGVERHTVSSG